MKRRKKIIAMSLSLLILLAGCGGGKGTTTNDTANGTAATGAAEPQRALKDTLTIAVNETVDQLDCGNVKLNTAHKVCRALYDPLVYPADESGEYKPCLAKSWEQKDDTTLIFHLRDDVVFHNGEKMTAEDVVFSIQRSCELPNNKTLFKAFDAENTKAIDDFTVQVKFMYPFAAALNYLSSSRGGVVSKKAVEEMGNDKFGLAPIGTGPFKFAKWIEGDRIVLERNEDYWGEKPAFKNLIYRFITDDSVRAMELEAGGIDAMFVVAPQDYDRLKENPDLMTYAESGFTTLMLQFNMRCDEFKDIRLRKAFAYAIDTSAIVKAVYGDLGTVADGLFTDQIFWTCGTGTNGP